MLRFVKTIFLSLSLSLRDTIKAAKKEKKGERERLQNCSGIYLKILVNSIKDLVVKTIASY